MSPPKEKFTAANLIPGRKYQVTISFEDFDKIIHHQGESWRFVRKNFLPYDDGLSLFVNTNGREILIRLQWRVETQGQIIDNFSDFVEEV